MNRRNLPKDIRAIQGILTVIRNESRCPYCNRILLSPVYGTRDSETKRRREIIELAQALLDTALGKSSLSPRGVAELRYHIDPNHPESAQNVIDQAVEANEAEK